MGGTPAGSWAASIDPPREGSNLAMSLVQDGRLTAGGHPDAAAGDNRCIRSAIAGIVSGTEFAMSC